MAGLPGRLGTLTARDVMTRDVIVLRETDTLEEAVLRLRTHHITGAPVIDDRGRLAGILSISDLVDVEAGGRAKAAAPVSLSHGHEGAATWDLYDKAGPLDAGAEGALVASRMSKQVTSITADAPLVEAARAMCDGHWHRVPVVDADGGLCGIISTMDVLAAIVNAVDEAGA